MRYINIKRPLSFFLRLIFSRMNICFRTCRFYVFVFIEFCFLIWASVMSRFHCYPCTLIACEENYGESSIWDALFFLFCFCFYTYILVLISVFMGFAYFALLEWITDDCKNLRYLSAISVKGLKIIIIYWDPLCIT